MADHTDPVLEQLQGWGAEHPDVHVVILTGSRAHPDASIDDYSDYDVEVYTGATGTFKQDDWLVSFGEVLIRWPLYPAPTLREDFITRLVYFKTGYRIDFQIASIDCFDPHRYDAGYRVLVDKPGLTQSIPAPTYREFLIRKPSKEAFLVLINDFFWDGTYVAKSLCRNEMFYAKYMLDGMMRFQYLAQMVDWYIGNNHSWTVNPNKHGRLYQKYLDPSDWKWLESTFAGTGITANWDAFFLMVQLFRRMAKTVASGLNYEYPAQLDADMMDHFRTMRDVFGKQKND